MRPSGNLPSRTVQSKLHLGDCVVVTTMLGRNVNYRISAQSVYAKAAGLPADIFAASREPRLVLITCGGAFDSDARDTWTTSSSTPGQPAISQIAFRSDAGRIP